MEERVAIFIDGSNLYHALKNNFHRYDLNFTEFINHLLGGRRLFRAYYYNVLQDQVQWPEGHREQQEFLEVLRRTPYLEVKLGSLKVSQGVPVEKGIDIMLATDLLQFAWRDFYDVAILVSGDADFIYALQTVKNLGKRVEVAYFEMGSSKELLSVADNRQLLDSNFFKNLWAGHHRRRRKSGGERGRGMPRETSPGQPGQPNQPGPSPVGEGQSRPALPVTVGPPPAADNQFRPATPGQSSQVQP